MNAPQQVATPPASRGMRVREWEQRDPDNPRVPLYGTLLIRPGMPVHEMLHAAYWAAKANFEKAIDAYRRAGKQGPEFYMLFRYGDDTIVGGGEYLAGDDAESMAWLSCMFNEMGFRVGTPLPGEHTTEEMGTPVFVVPVDRAEFGL